MLPLENKGSVLTLLIHVLNVWCVLPLRGGSSFDFYSLKWAGLSSAYLMLFPGLLSQFKKGVTLIGFLCVPSVDWCPQMVNHTGDASTMEHLDSLKLPGRWEAQQGWWPSNCWNCFGLASVWNYEGVTLAISICDSSILWQTYGCKMGKAITALPWELLFYCYFPQYGIEVFAYGKLQKVFRLSFFISLLPSLRLDFFLTHKGLHEYYFKIITTKHW